MLIWNQLKAQAAAQPEKRALICGDTTLTYAQFAAQVEIVAQAWLRQGLQPGDRIALHMRNGIELATCYYACFAAGLVAVPVNTRLTPEEIAYVLEHSGSKAYLAPADLRIPTSLPSPEFDTASDHGVKLALPVPKPDDPALLLYTSGTTARPKGVSHSQRTLAGNASYMDAWGLRPEDHTLLFTAMVHASGAIMLLMSSLWMGATVTIVPVFDAAKVLDTWESSGATFYMSLPTLVRALLAEQRARPRNITTGRLAICGGDVVPVPLQQEYAATFGHPMVEGFGMTEGLPTLANHPDNNRPGSMGRLVGDVEIRAVEGELRMRGAGIATGYWGHPPFEDGWLKTGDLVEIDPDGFVWFRGRKKEIIVRGGSNIAPQEVEETLYKHPAVGEAGVIGEPNEYWGEVVLAYVALRDGHSVSAEELIAFARQHLAEYKCPEQILFLPMLPKGATGKVQRRAL
ncbi:MAG: AMP-binding protein [Acidobacteriia bacterium]|nr:AMP-binding protein [Terriglobia bacterium]